MNNEEKIQTTGIYKIIEDLNLEELVKCILEDQDLNKIEIENTPLIAACRTNQSEIVDFLISCGCEPDLANQFGETPLSICAQFGNPINLDLLLMLGANPNSQDRSGRIPLMHAIMNRHLKAIQILIDGGSDLDIEDDFGMTSLMYSLKFLSPEDLEALYGQGDIEKMKKQVEEYPEKAKAIKEKRSALMEKVKSQGPLDNDEGSMAVKSLQKDKKGAELGGVLGSKRATDAKEAEDDSMTVKTLGGQGFEEKATHLGGKIEGGSSEDSKQTIKASQTTDKEESERRGIKSRGYKEEDIGGVKISKRENQAEEIDDELKVKKLSVEEAAKKDSPFANKKMDVIDSPEGPSDLMKVKAAQKEKKSHLPPEEYAQFKDDLDETLADFDDYDDDGLPLEIIKADKSKPKEFKNKVSETIERISGQPKQIVKAQNIAKANDSQIVRAAEKDVQMVKGNSENTLTLTDSSKGAPKVAEKVPSALKMADEKKTKVGQKIEEVNETVVVKSKTDNLIEGEKSTQTQKKATTQEENIISKDSSNLDLGLEKGKKGQQGNEAGKPAQGKSDLNLTGKKDTELVIDKAKKDDNKKQKVGGGDLNFSNAEKQEIKKSETQTLDMKKGDEKQVVKSSKDELLFEDEKTTVKEKEKPGDQSSQSTTVSSKKAEKKEVELEIIQSNEKEEAAQKKKDLEINIDEANLIPKDKVNEKNKKGQTHLMTAAGKGDIKKLELLLKSGAETGLKDFQGFNALMYAAQAGKTEAVKLLAERTSELDVKTGKGYTALSLAVLKNHGDAVAALVNAGAKTDIEIMGETLLGLAVQKDALEAIKKLVALGLNPFEKNKKGKSAVDIAKKLKKKKLVNFFNKQMAKLVK